MKTRVLGTVSILIYNKLLKSLQEANPELQGINSPFAVLKKFSRKQIILLQGEFKKQEYLLRITEQTAPNVDLSKLEKIPENVFDDCQDFVVKHLQTLS